MRLTIIIIIILDAINITIAQESFASLNGLNLITSETGAIAPPIVYNPEIESDDEFIKFRWKSTLENSGFDCRYKVDILKTKELPYDEVLVFSAVTDSSYYVLSSPSDYLKKNFQYYIKITNLMSEKNKNYFTESTHNQLLFSYIPDCTPPKNFLIKETGKNYVVLSWDGTPAEYENVQYEIRFGLEGQKNSEKSIITVSNINSYKIANVDSNFPYTFEIRKICNQREAEFSTWEKLDYISKRPFLLPSVLCGTDIDLPNYDSLYEFCLNHPQFGFPDDSIIFIGGFPLKVDWVEFSECSESTMPIIETNSVSRWIFDTVWCNRPITEEITFDSIIYVDHYIYEEVWDTLCYENRCWIPDTVQVECNTIPKCPPLIETPVLLRIDSMWIGYTTDTVQVVLLDTIGWENIVCSTPLVQIWETITDTVGFDSYYCNCSLMGEGVIPLPFLSEKVRVRFNNVHLRVELLPNQEVKHYIYDGNAYGIWDDRINTSIYDSSPVVFGGDICVVSPSQNQWNPDGTHSVTGTNLDPNGFTQSGEYSQQPPYPGWQQGDPIDTTGTFDPWGFDANGIHRETGTTENPNGCTREQLMSPPQSPPCDTLPPPYAWLNSTPITSSGSSFANNVKDTLDRMILRLLNSMSTEVVDSLHVYSNRCNSIRDDMESLLDQLDYDRVFVFGQGDIYFTKGMHEQFSEEPKTLGVNLERIPGDEELEKKHVALYHCDKKEVSLERMDSIIQVLISKISDLKAGAMEKLKRLSGEEINKLNQSTGEFDKWVIEFLKKEANSIYEDSYSFIQTLPQGKDDQLYFLKNPFKKQEVFNPASYTASLKNDTETFLMRAFSTQQEEIAFQIKQGWSEIEGLERVYYLEKIKEARGNVCTAASPYDPTLMPIIVGNRGDDGRKYEVYLDQIVFTPYEASLDAHMLLEVPNNGQKIAFVARDVKFGPGGPKINPVKLELKNDVNVRLSNAFRLSIKNSPNTFISFDCDGFAGIGLEGELEICREYVKPFDPITNLISEDSEDRVSARFTTAISSWGSFYADLSLEPFVITGIEDIRWIVDKVAFDFSDIKSPTGSTPPDYPHPFARGNKFQNLWKGVYIGHLEARLVNEFSGSSDPISIAARDVVIDDLGFSGTVSVANLLPLEKGNASGWAFSMDQFEISVIKNRIKSSTFSGKINVPLFQNVANCNGAPDRKIEQADCFNYKAFLEFGNKYHFTVDMGQENFCIDIMKAGQVVLNNNSSIKMKLENGQFDAEANLCGSLSIGYDFGNGKEINASNITFQNVKIRNKAPYFDPGTWGFPNSVGVKLAGFGLTIKGLSLKKANGNDQMSELKFTTLLQLVTDSSSKIDLTASAGFRILGNLVTTTDSRQRWVFNEFKVDEIYLKGSFPGVKKIEGQLTFYENDPNYGKGFKGKVGVIFNAFKTEIDLEALAQFGSMSGNSGSFKYFFVDLMANIDPGIPVGGAFDLTGFGGGVYYRMSRDSDSFGGLPANPTGPINLPSALGVSLSGIRYTPDRNAGLGLKATVAFGLSLKPDAFNANATFEIQFNSNGGLSKVWFYGNGRLMAPKEIQASTQYTPGVKPNNGALASCNVSIQMAFDKGFSLDGELEVYINLLNGSLTGQGKAKIYAGSDGWFINVGTPTNRVFLEASVLGLNLLKLESYLDIGTKIPRMPGVPSNVSSLTGLGNIMSNESLRATGRGFAFGSSISIGTMGRKYFISKDHIVYFYGDLSLGAGFDIMLQDYGGATCAGSGNAIGINGWYAAGQAWAYLRAEVGVGVKIWGKRKEFSVLDLSAAAALQMKLPNPFVAKGAIGGQYRLLGGLIKGKINFQFTIGESCQIVGGQDPASDLNIILNTYPEDGAENVSTDTKPMINFNIPIGKKFSISDIQGTQKELETEINFLKLMQNGSIIPAKYVWNEDSTSISIRPYIMLEGRKDYALEIKVTLKDGNSVVKVEHDTINFSTDMRPHSIPVGNVIASYPLDGQYNFYVAERRDQQGYIILDTGQGYLFPNDSPNEQKNGYSKAIIARFTPKNGGEKFSSVVTYDERSKRLIFDMPAENFSKETYYKLEIIEAYYAWANIAPPVIEKGPFGGGTTQQNSTVGNYIPPDPVILYTSYFRTSKYDRFFDKIDEIQSTLVFKSKNNWKIIADILSNEEPLDEYELNGNGNIKPLVRLKFDLSGEMLTWFNHSIKNKVYDVYNVPYCVIGQDRIDFYDYTKEIRDEEFLNGASYLTQSDGTLLLVTEENFISQNVSLPSVQFLNFTGISNLKKDYYDFQRMLFEIRDNVIRYCENGYAILDGCYEENIIECFRDYESVMNNPFPIPPNDFKFKIEYWLPGETNGLTSSKAVEFTIPGN